MVQCGLFDDLDFKTIDKIVDVKRKNDIVQYAELVVNGERVTYGTKS